MAEGEGENKTEAVLIRLSPSTKADWEDALANSRFDSLSGAVRGVMNDYFDSPQPAREETSDVDLEPVHQKLDHVTDQLDDLRTQINDVQTTAKERSETDVLRLANVVSQHIPYVEDPEDLPPLRTASTIQDNEAQRAMMMGTADALADAVGASESTVRRALSILEDDREDLNTIEESGFTRYYFDEGDAPMGDVDDE